MITDKESFFEATKKADISAMRLFLSDEKNHSMLHRKCITLRNWTGLHFTAHNEDDEMCKLFIECGAKALVFDIIGKKPSDYTSSPEIKDLLQQKEREEELQERKERREKESKESKNIDMVFNPIFDYSLESSRQAQPSSKISPYSHSNLPNHNLSSSSPPNHNPSR